MGKVVKKVLDRVEDIVLGKSEKDIQSVERGKK